jgi:hypothetical protein
MRAASAVQTVSRSGTGTGETQTQRACVLKQETIKCNSKWNGGKVAKVGTINIKGLRMLLKLVWPPRPMMMRMPNL